MRVLDEDPDLASALEPGALAQAQLKALAPLLVLPSGEWHPPTRPRHPGRDLGLLVLAGLLRRDVEIAGRMGSELLGPEDLLRPWDDVPEVISIAGQVSWTALEPTRLAWLDGDFANAAVEWPQLVTALLERSVRRARLLGFTLAVLELKHVHLRLLLLLWSLADRFGHVHPEGVHLDVRLTHELLAHMVGAHRTSVTVAVQRLAREGRVERDDSGAWVLLGGPPRELRDLEPALSAVPGR